MVVTLDASVAAAWLFPDEASPAADAMLANAVSGGVRLQAPGLWAWETGNLIRMATVRRRLARRDWPAALQTLSDANVRLEAPPDADRMGKTLELTAACGLTFYDASYLEQAQRTGARLATKDKALRKAAVALGVPCLSL